MRVLWGFVAGPLGLVVGAVWGFVAAVFARSNLSSRKYSSGKHEVLICVPLGAALGLITGLMWMLW